MGGEKGIKRLFAMRIEFFMAFFPRNSVNFYCATWNARALNCYATVLLCNSIGHGRGLDRVFGCLNVLSPTRDDFWPGYKAGTHLFILVLPRWITLRFYIPPPPLGLSAFFFFFFCVFVPSPLLGSTHFIEQLFL